MSLRITNAGLDAPGFNLMSNRHRVVFVMLAMLGLFCLGATLQTFAMRQQEMTSTYITVLGFEAICAFLVGSLLLGEQLTWQKVAGGIIVCVGVALMHEAI